MQIKGSQEESVFRNTSLFLSLWPHRKEGELRLLQCVVVRVDVVVRVGGLWLRLGLGLGLGFCSCPCGRTAKMPTCACFSASVLWLVGYGYGWWVVVRVGGLWLGLAGCG